MKAILIFIDGIGIGPYNPQTNPCTDSRLKVFNLFYDHPRSAPIPYGGYAKAIDATLGKPGLPQSATGQTALLTGVNSVKMLGYHRSGFPNKKLRNLLASHSILKTMQSNGGKAAFLNAYHPLIFEVDPATIIRRLSVTSVATWKAGIPFKSFDDLRAEQAVFHDFTNRDLLKKGYSVPEWKPAYAGKVLSHSARPYDFCLYEYFKTDRAGHKQDFRASAQLLVELEQFILASIRQTDLDATTVLVTSDHGNIEDNSVKTHTANPVPLIVWGALHDIFMEKVKSITDITPLLVSVLTNHFEKTYL